MLKSQKVLRQSRIEAVDTMEHAVKKQLAALIEPGNIPVENKVDETESVFDQKFVDFRNWLVKNSDSGQVQAESEKFKETIYGILDKAWEEVSELAISKEFHDTVQAGKSFFSGLVSLDFP